MSAEEDEEPSSTNIDDLNAFLNDPVGMAKAACSHDDDDEDENDNQDDDDDDNPNDDNDDDNQNDDDDNDDDNHDNNDNEDDDDDDDDGEEKKNIDEFSVASMPEFETRISHDEPRESEPVFDESAAAAAAQTRIKHEEFQEELYHREEQAAATSSSSATTVINGKGIWHSWTRNFATPLLALLDLLDNAIDAASLHHKGRIYIQADEHIQTNTTTGMLIYNNSLTPIKPLQKVLEVYTSLKGAHADSIGENGVGLKQGCATLSNLSFCLVKSDGKYSLGVIAYQLQSIRGCSLPSYPFQATNVQDLKQEMIQLFCSHNSEQEAVAECISKYGGGNVRTGIDRLVEKFEYMTSSDWKQYPHVFGLVIDHLKHGETNTNVADIDLSTDQKERVRRMLNTLYTDLPKRYLHIPTQLLDVRVDSQPVNFNFWQPRLVEMAQLDLNISKTTALSEDSKFKKKEGEEASTAASDAAPAPAPAVPAVVDTIVDPDTYKLRIYLGFDALRVCDEKAQKTASMYIYSRQSGRLIKMNVDCRGELGLTSGGTDYCQGLTLIVDDCHANFPLNPTKQDVAFGEQANGETHKRNLYMWLNAAVRLYYGYYKDQICGKQKKVLTETLRRMEDEVYCLIEASRTTFRSLSECKFSTFSEFASNNLMSGNQTIRLLPSKSIDYLMGNDTRLRMPSIPAQHVSSSMMDNKPKGRKQTSRNSNASKYFDEEYYTMMDEDMDDSGRMNDYTISSSSRRRAPAPEPVIPLSSASPTSTGKRKRKQCEMKSDRNRRRTSNGSAETGGGDYVKNLEKENRKLKKEKKEDTENYQSIIQKRMEEKEQLQMQCIDLQTEVDKQRKQIQVLQQKLKAANERLRMSSSSSTHHDNISIISSPNNNSKDAKRWRNEKNKNLLLKQENEDLKEQVRSQQEMLRRKDNTIQSQRRLLDQRDQEDEDEDDGLECDSV